MVKLVISFLVLLLACNLAYAKELKPILEVPQAKGCSVKLYFSPDEVEYATDVIKYENYSFRSNNYYTRTQKILSYPRTMMTDKGKVYADGTRQVDYNDSWDITAGWASESFGTVTEFDLRTTLAIERKFIYALDENDNVVKYKILYKQKNKFMEEEYYEPVAVYKQNSGRLSPKGKQSKFSEIKEYDMQGNITSIYKRNQYDHIDEYTPDGKLKTRHLTSSIPYLQWSEDNKDKYDRAIYNTIDKYEENLYR